MHHRHLLAVFSATLFVVPCLDDGFIYIAKAGNHRVQKKFAVVP